jgi:hypothetical protein
MTCRRDALSGASFTSIAMNYTGAYATMQALPDGIPRRKFRADRSSSVRLDHSPSETHHIFFPTARAPISSRRRSRKPLAATVILRFSQRMSGDDSAGSKLSASMTRQHGRRIGVSCVDNLARRGSPSVASFPVPQAAAETVPVSAPFGFARGWLSVVSRSTIGVRA